MPGKIMRFDCRRLTLFMTRYRNKSGNKKASRPQDGGDALDGLKWSGN
jgi:hypothetical protein